MASGVAVLELRRSPTAGTRTPFGELLVDGALLLRTSRPFTTAPSLFTVPVPLDVALCGLEVHVQGFCRAATASAPRRKVGWIGGALSNAADLVLGF